MLETKVQVYNDVLKSLNQGWVENGWEDINLYFEK